MSHLEVACASEGRAYVAHTAAMLHSLFERNAGSDVRVHWLHGPEMDERLRRRVAEWGEGRIGFVEIDDDRLAGLPTSDFTRKATWYRLLLPELLPGCGRVLQLDSDLIVVDSLAPLWSTELGEGYVAAVSNVLEPEYRDHPRALGLERAYFNAGVLLMNLEAMRRDGCTEAMLEYGRANRPMWRDQDTLNAVLGARRVELHPRWNVMNIFRFSNWAEEVFGAEALAEAVRDPAVRHFEGPGDNKPWHLLCDRDDRELYLRHRRATPWPRVRREGVTPLNLARKARRRLRRS